MKATVVAYDGIAVIVNASNPVKALTKKQVEQIFTGEISDWSAVGGAAERFRSTLATLLRHLCGFQEWR